MTQQQIAYEKHVNAGAVNITKVTVVRVGGTIQCPNSIIHGAKRRLMRKGLRAYECTATGCNRRVLFGEIAK
jgi:hypothetical protein